MIMHLHDMQGSSRVLDCFRKAREQLSHACAAALFDHELVISEMVVFNKPLLDVCLPDIKRFCSDVEDGNGEVFRCLQDHQDKVSVKCGEVRQE
jgi:golgi apparatus protein 1